MNEIEELNIYTNSRCAWSNINFSLSLSFSPFQYTEMVDSITKNKKAYKYKHYIHIHVDTLN